MDNTRIIVWNCQGVSRKRLDLIQFTQRRKIDILLLNETHLSKQSNFKLPNYHTYATNRPKTSNRPPGGGTAILIHRRLIHHQVHIPTNSIENTSIHVQMGKEEICISAVYKKPTNKLDTSDINSILNSPLSTIIAGDLNAKHTLWNSRTTNSAGNSLELYITSRNDTIITAPTTPTHYPDNPNHNPDVLDIAIMKTGSLQYHLENLTSDLSSDHTPIIIDIQAQTSQTSPPKPLRSVDWASFKEDMAQTFSINPNTNTAEEIDAAINQITATISRSLSKNTSLFTLTDLKKDLPRNIEKQLEKKTALALAEN